MKVLSTGAGNCIKKLIVGSLLFVFSISASAQCQWTWANEKWEHVLAGGQISLFIPLISRHHDFHQNRGLLAGFLAGVGKEAFDAVNENESTCAHFADIGITTGGAAVPWAIATVIKHYRQKRKSSETTYADRAAAEVMSSGSANHNPAPAPSESKPDHPALDIELSASSSPNSGPAPSALKDSGVPQIRSPLADVGQLSP